MRCVNLFSNLSVEKLAQVMSVSGRSQKLLSAWLSLLALTRIELAQPLRIRRNTFSISTDYSIVPKCQPLDWQ